MTFHRLFDGSKAQKLRKCPECHGKYLPKRNGQPCCDSLVCKELYALKVVAKAQRKREKIERANDRVKSESLKTRSQWMKEAQIAFNAFIRERDRNQTCICCGRSLTLDAIGGGYDCGHYRSVGSAPHLRFNESNAHAQRKQCNRYGAGRAVDYRIGLIGRLGLAAVEALEADQTERKYTIEELKAIKAIYTGKLKELKRG